MDFSDAENNDVATSDFFVDGLLLNWKNWKIEKLTGIDYFLLFNFLFYFSYRTTHRYRYHGYH